MVSSALSDLKVIEYADFISGPFCGKLMADLGAEVIKIEGPSSGDSSRRHGPFFKDEPHPEQSGLFLYLNTNKKSLTLNLKTSTGASIFRELIQGADVLIENTPPSTMKDLGLDYGTLRQLNPRLVMTSITPFGQYGPYVHYKADDLICCQMSGLSYNTPFGGVNNQEEEPPLKPGGRQSDFIAGSTAAIATMFGLSARQTSGSGQYIDISQREAVASFLRHQIPFYTYDPQGIYLSWYGSRTQGRRGLGYLPCQNGYVANGCREEYQWKAFLEMVVGPGWENDERLKSLFSKGFDLFTFLDSWEIVRPIVTEWTARHTKEDITAAAQARGIPIVPYNSSEDVFKSSQFQAHGFFVEVDHPCTGKLRYPGAPYKLSGTPWQINSPAPLLGQHNEEILCNRLGYTRQDLVVMRQSGII